MENSAPQPQNTAANQPPQPASPIPTQPENAAPPSQENTKKQSQGKLVLLGFLLILMLGIILCIGYYLGLRQGTNEGNSTLPAPTSTQPENTSSPTPVVCTQDAQVCPDGSFVGRVGPNCEFAACPAAPTHTEDH